jgi:hypothetical protein
MRLAVRIDPVAIALRVAIILMAANHCADDAAQDCTGNSAGTGADAREN